MIFPPTPQTHTKEMAGENGHTFWGLTDKKAGDVVYRQFIDARRVGSISRLSITGRMESTHKLRPITLGHSCFALACMSQSRLD